MEQKTQYVKKRQRLSSIKQISTNENYVDVERIQNLFKKHFTIVERSSYTLPHPESLFMGPSWKLEPLQKLKTELNEVKDRLSNYNLDEWQLHTRFMNSAKDVMKRIRTEVQPEFVTQAWCKFYEIASRFPLISLHQIKQHNNYFKSVHLCEAPGAFVTSLNHWLRTHTVDVKWEWAAMTLNPYYEGNPSSIMISDDRFIRHTFKHWCFGEDNTGNLMDIKNLDALINFCEPCQDILLVTADGSINCMDMPDEQENAVSHLHFCETVAALYLLAAGGSYLLKIFTTFEHHSICLLYLLSCCFENVSVIKPVTSKEGNSETYVVCTNFKGQMLVPKYLEIFRKYYESGPDKPMFSKDDIPHMFLKKVVNCSNFFKCQQCSVIVNNIATFTLSRSSSIFNEVRQVQQIVADRFMKEYNLKQLTSGEIIGRTLLEKANTVNTCRTTWHESYNQRCRRQKLSPTDQLTEYLNCANQMQIHTPLNKSIVFKIRKLPDDLRISLAKKFENVYSSQFCSAEILRHKIRIDHIMDQLERKIQFPSTDKAAELPPEHSVLHFNPIEFYDTYRITETIVKQLKTFESGETLILQNYPMLTHFNVELLYLIGSSFDCLKIKICDKIGSKITLEHYNCQVNIRQHLIDIETISRNAEQNEKIVLKILPAAFLYETDLYPTIIDVNHWIIKLYAQLCMHSTSHS